MNDVEKLEQTIEVLTMLKNEWLCEKAITPQLCTPPGIKFIVSKDGNTWGVLFNESRQRLGYRTPYDVYEVMAVDVKETNLIVAEGLPMTPCEYVELPHGAFFSFEQNPRLEDIRLKLPDRDGRYCAMVTPESGVEPFHCAAGPCWKIGR